MQKRQLAMAATRLLRKAGCMPDGRRRGSVAQDQQRFERRLIIAPHRGKSTKD